MKVVFRAEHLRKKAWLFGAQVLRFPVSSALWGEIEAAANHTRHRYTKSHEHLLPSLYQYIKILSDHL